MRTADVSAISNLVLERKRTWTLHAKGTLGVLIVSLFLAALAATQCHYTLKMTEPRASAIPSAIFGCVAWIWWGVVAGGMWWVATRVPWLLRFSIKSLFAHAASAILIGYVHLHALQLTIYLNSIYWPLWGKGYRSLDFVNLSRFGLDLASYGLVFGLSGLLYTQSERQEEALQKFDLERQLAAAQLKALQAQMEPHFLFNTLNAITSLVAQGRNKEAMTTLSHLNAILRATLQRRVPEKVRFAEELHIIQSYLAIQKTRFADRLEVQIDITPDAMDALVPSFLLQPIVENAIEHGISPKPEGGLIVTHAHRVGEMLAIRVNDNGYGYKAPRTTGYGIGMKNTRERLAYFYPGAHDFCATAHRGGYEVTIHIPYERAN